jgi:hypothetical protein
LAVAGREKDGSDPFGEGTDLILSAIAGRRGSRMATRCPGITIPIAQARPYRHTDSNSMFFSIFFNWFMSLSKCPLYIGFSVTYETDIVVSFSVIHKWTKRVVDCMYGKSNNNKFHSFEEADHTRFSFY